MLMAFSIVASDAQVVVLKKEQVIRKMGKIDKCQLGMEYFWKLQN